jgi:hypothetical protein
LHPGFELGNTQLTAIVEAKAFVAILNKMPQGRSAT